MDGASPYLLATPFPYLYPATLAFLLIPLTLVPPIVGAGHLVCAECDRGSCGPSAGVVLFVRPQLEQRPDDAAAFLALFFTFFFPIVQSNLRNGQVNFLVLALCVAAALPRHGRDVHLFPLAAGPHPRRELTLTPSRGFACPRLGVAAGAPARAAGPHRLTPATPRRRPRPTRPDADPTEVRMSSARRDRRPPDCPAHLLHPTRRRLGPDPARTDADTEPRTRRPDSPGRRRPDAAPHRLHPSAAAACPAPAAN